MLPGTSLCNFRYSAKSHARPTQWTWRCKGLHLRINRTGIQRCVCSTSENSPFILTKHCCYKESSILVAMRSRLYPTPDQESQFGSMDLNLSLDMPQIPLQQSRTEWEAWGEESTIELCEVQLGFDGHSSSMSMLFHSCFVSSAKTSCNQVFLQILYRPFRSSLDYGSQDLNLPALLRLVSTSQHRQRIINEQMVPMILIEGKYTCFRASLISVTVSLYTVLENPIPRQRLI